MIIDHHQMIRSCLLSYYYQCVIDYRLLIIEGYQEGCPPELSCCRRRLRSSPRGKGVESRNMSTAPLSKTGLSGSTRFCVSLSESAPMRRTVT